MITKLEINGDGNAKVGALAGTGTKVFGSTGREWQLEALDKLRDSQFSVLVAPCGSGKSTVQVGLAIEDIVLSHESILQLFVVPQTHIAGTFFQEVGYSLSIKGKTFNVDINPMQNFCDQSSIKRLVALLLTDRKVLAQQGMSGLFAITSHHALRLAWARMSAAERKYAIHNLHIRVDEGHHTTMDEEDSNQIGGICKYVVESGDETAKLTLSTATDFRGDNRDILLPEIKSKFKYYSLDWLKHWGTLGIKDFSIEMQEFEKVPFEQVAKNVCSEKDRHHYIAVPPKNVKWRSRFDDSSHGVDALIAEIRLGWPECRILNLVEQEERKAKKAALLNEPKTAKDGDPQFDVVITCYLGREGTDWVPCSRVHVTYIEGSITQAVQTLGRMLRSYDGKTDVVARYYYPAPIFAESMTKQELLDDRKNALLLMLQWQEMYYPIVFPSRPPHDGTHPKGLKSLMGSKYNEMKDEFIDLAIDNGVMAGSDEDIDAIISQVLEDYHLPDEENNHDTLRTILLRAANPSFKGVNIEFVREAGFANLYNSLTKSDKALVFDHDSNTMHQLRAIVTQEWHVVFEKVKNLKTLEELSQHPNLKKWVLNQKDKVEL